MLLWKVTRKKVTDDKNVEITLPEPVALTIRSDIPEKSAKQEFWIVGRMSDRVDWKSDSILYRHIQVPNPGEKVLEPLPPGQYAVERINFTPQGTKSNSVSMAMCERRLLSFRRENARTSPLTARRAVGWKAGCAVSRTSSSATRLSPSAIGARKNSSSRVARSRECKPISM